MAFSESKMAAKMFETHQKYHKTYILHIVFLIIEIVYNVFIMFIVSVNISIDCLISVPLCYKWRAVTAQTARCRRKVLSIPYFYYFRAYQMQ